MIPVAEKDLLEQDPHIRGQNYACLSFLSPEDIVKKKESYYFENYVQHFSKRMNELFDNLETHFKDKKDDLHAVKDQFEHVFDNTKISEDFKFFIANNSEVLDTEFNKMHDYQTSVRGIKIRGVYDSVQEAQARCEHLRKMDNEKFNIYISEVGAWCPWDPNPNDIKDQNYAVDSLNTMMHEYEKNLQNKDEHYAQRKNELKRRLAENEEEKIAQRTEDESVEDLKTNLDKMDPRSEQITSQSSPGPSPSS